MILIIGLVVCGYIAVRMFELVWTDGGDVIIRYAALAMLIGAFIAAYHLLRLSREAGAALQQGVSPGLF